MGSLPRSQGFGELGTRRVDAAIDEHLAIRPGQNGDVAAGALKHADIIPDLVRRDRRLRGIILEHTDEPSRLCKSFARREPFSRCRISRAADAAEAKASSRQ